MELDDKMKISFPLTLVGIFINQSHVAIQMKLQQARANIRSALPSISVDRHFTSSLVDVKREMLHPDTMTYGKIDFFINDNYAIGGQERQRYPIVLTTDQSGYDHGIGRMLSREGNVMMIKSKPAIQLTHSLSLIL